MAGIARELGGQRFGKLLVIRLVGKSGRENIWRCSCACGQVTEVRVSNLTSGNTRSCGCEQRSGLVNNFNERV